MTAIKSCLAALLAVLVGGALLRPALAAAATVHSAGVDSNLTVAKAGSGSGTVTSDAGAIDCGVTCSGTYADGTIITLAATPAVGNQFIGWLGPCTGAGTCQFTINGTTTAEATFAPAALGAPTLDIDGTAVFGALTDGLLVIRYLFGLSGAGLIDGAVGTGATRTTDMQIGGYLADIKPALDIDGDGRADALTDGLLIIRYLSGLRGASLIAGAVGAGAIRTAAADIEAQTRSLLTSPSIAKLRGTNLVGMEMRYSDFPQSTGPIAGTNYPVHDTRLIDYLASKNIRVIRFLFSWEGMQSALNGPIPAAPTGHYKGYFDNYQRIVDYATNVRGMRVIVEPWQANSGGGAGGAMWRGNLVGSAAVPTSAFADFWSKMAGAFAGNPLVSFGLVNEPNNQSTMQWWAAAQAAITAIRGAAATQRIYVPGNGYTGGSSWTSNYYDTAPIKRSNAYGWLNANGPDSPITDPLNDIVAEIHVYIDPDESGSSTAISSITAARDHIAVTLNEATAHGYRIFVGETGWYAGAANATAAWADFVSYFEDANPAVFTGYAWWAAGSPGWWDDAAANGGGHFSITPTNGTTFTGDTVNMTMIQGDFLSNRAASPASTAAPAFAESEAADKTRFSHARLPPRNFERR